MACFVCYGAENDTLKCCFGYSKSNILLLGTP